jgi:hypothetical protein
MAMTSGDGRNINLAVTAAGVPRRKPTPAIAKESESPRCPAETRKLGCDEAQGAAPAM